MRNVLWNRNRRDWQRDAAFIGQRTVSDDARRIRLSILFSSSFKVQLQAELRNLERQNNEIRRETNRCDHDLHKYDEKLQVLENMTQLATQSLEHYFQAVRFLPFRIRFRFSRV